MTWPLKAERPSWTACRQWSEIRVVSGKMVGGGIRLLSESHVHLLFNLFGPFGFTWGIGKIVISDPPALSPENKNLLPATPCAKFRSLLHLEGQPFLD